LGTGWRDDYSPALARDEELQSTTQESMFNYVRLSDGGTPRHPGPKRIGDDRDIAIGVLGEGGLVDWRRMDHTTIGRRSPDRTRSNRWRTSIKQSRSSTAVASCMLRFPTPRAAPDFACMNSARTQRTAAVNDDTVRGQFNTVVYEEEETSRPDWRDVILMNREDIERLGLRVDQLVAVRSDVGQMERIIVRDFDIRAGNAAMYYPEANVIVPRRIDPRSRTPAYKSVLVEVVPHLDGAVSLTVHRSEIAKRREMHAC
jgi:hypothetical protein